MAKRSSERTLKDIKAALKIFPKIVKQKEKAYREKEKVLKNFAPLARELFKLTQGRANNRPRIFPINGGSLTFDRFPFLSA